MLAVFERLADQEFVHKARNRQKCCLLAYPAKWNIMFHGRLHHHDADQKKGKRTKILASQHVGKESVVARCSELFLLDTHFGFLAL